MDWDLLISVSNGLGSFQTDEAGVRRYVKDQDCLGEAFQQLVGRSTAEHAAADLN